MKRQPPRLSLLLIYSLISTISLLNAEQTNIADRDVQWLSTDDPVVFMEASVREAQRYDSLVKQLIRMLKSDSDARIHVTAAGLLGKFRAPEAIPVLIDRLTQVKSSSRTGRSLTSEVGGYTCAMALISIGDPAVGSILERLSGRMFDNPEEISVAAKVLKEILGAEAATNKIYSVRSEQVPENRAQLEQALWCLHQPVPDSSR